MNWLVLWFDFLFLFSKADISQYRPADYIHFSEFLHFDFTIASSLLSTYRVIKDISIINSLPTCEILEFGITR
jgi:hypothetical protein